VIKPQPEPGDRVQWDYLGKKGDTGVVVKVTPKRLSGGSRAVVRVKWDKNGHVGAVEDRVLRVLQKATVSSAQLDVLCWLSDSAILKRPATSTGPATMSWYSRPSVKISARTIAVLEKRGLIETFSVGEFTHWIVTLEGRSWTS
jgi:hypothetical protein